MYFIAKNEVVKYLGKKTWFAIEKIGMIFKWDESRNGVLVENLDFLNDYSKFSIFTPATWYEGIVCVKLESKKVWPQLIWWFEKKERGFVSWWQLLPCLFIKTIASQVLGRGLDPLAKYPFVFFLEFNLPEIYKKDGFKATVKAVINWPN